MKQLRILAVILTLVACKSETKNNETVKVKIDKSSQIETSNNSAVKESKKNGTYLCKINGKDWNYTKASGIVSRHKKTNKREAIFTFTKQLDKGKEIVQLFYDGDMNKLEKVNIHLKVPKTDGKKMTAMYIFSANLKKKYPNAKMAGTIDLTNPNNASGNASVLNLDVRFDKQNIKKEADKMITVDGLTFKGIGYSESGKLFGSQGISAND